MKKYGKIENNTVIEIIQKPKWFYDNGEEIFDDNIFIEENIYPIDETNKEYNDEKYNQSENDLENLIIDNDLKIIKNYYILTPKSLNEIYNSVLSKIDNKREDVLYNNITVYIDKISSTENHIIPVQFRNEIDLRNLSTLSSKSMKKIIDINEFYNIKRKHFFVSIDERDNFFINIEQNTIIDGMYIMVDNLYYQRLNDEWVISEELNNFDKIYFMDETDTLRELRSYEMINLCEEVYNRSQNVYSKSWEHKHVNLKAIYENVSLTEEQKIDQLLDYNFMIGWV